MSFDKTTIVYPSIYDTASAKEISERYKLQAASVRATYEVVLANFHMKDFSKSVAHADQMDRLERLRDLAEELEAIAEYAGDRMTEKGLAAAIELGV